MTIEELRYFFPQTKEKVYGKPLVYLDNAATSMRPRSVIDVWSQMSLQCNSNLHRAIHHTADIATSRYEDARKKVADFIGAGSPSNIIFTSGATASLNLLSYTLFASLLKPGDEIIVGESEHHSNIVPWKIAASRVGAVVKILPVDENGVLREDLLESLIDERTRFVCIAHISNVLGIINPVRTISEIAHSHGCIVICDGAQGIVHDKVNVQELGVDFYAFSGHKLYAAPGTGVLYGKKVLLDSMPPFMGGGEMIDSVSWDRITYAPVPQKFEAGTQNISGVPTLVPAIEMAELMRGDAEIRRNSDDIRDYILDALRSDPGITLYGNPENAETKVPVFSFCVDGAHHEDLALILDKMGIAVRSGQMCAEPLMNRFGVTGMVRASFAPYNTMQEAEYFVQSLHKAAKMLK